MKNLLKSVLVFIMLFSFHQLIAQGDVESTAKDIIKAYKTKDTELLKKYASGFMVNSINESYFESRDAKPLVSIAKKWNGKIKEIRYSKGEMMGKEVLLASVYFSDNENGNLNVVLLSSYEESDWKAFVMGIMDVSKSEFEEGTTEMPKEGDGEVEPEEEGRSGFSIEMANGDTYEKPTTTKLIELLKSVNDENFFLILNRNESFLQTSISEKGYVVQYSDNDGMFEAEEYFTLEMLNDIFIAYIDNADWKLKAKWVAM